jgi:hypothetical protein
VVLMVVVVVMMVVMSDFVARSLDGHTYLWMLENIPPAAGPARTRLDIAEVTEDNRLAYQARVNCLRSESSAVEYSGIRPLSISGP